MRQYLTRLSLALRNAGISSSSRLLLTAHRIRIHRQLEGWSVFREGISPLWEDSMNADGGEFFIRSSGSQLSVQQLDEFWEQTVLGMIGETLDPGGEICGARVVDKSKHKGPAYRLELWFRRNNPQIGDDMKQRFSSCLAEVNNGRVPKLDYRNHKF